MYTEERTAVIATAQAKVALFRERPFSYFISSMLAGIFVGFGVLLAFTIGGLLEGLPYAKPAMGAAFGIALSLVVISGAELFTGNNLVVAFGMAGGTYGWGTTVRLWAFCFLGNLAGGIFLSLLFWGAGLAVGPVGSFMATIAAAKMSLAPLALLLRGILCNVLVCLAVWCGYRCKSESGKLIMIFWCLFAFVTIGFEHSVANMTLMTIALLNPNGAAVSFTGWLYNLGFVTLGNIIGGLLVAYPYLLLSKKHTAAAVK